MFRKRSIASDSTKAENQRTGGVDGRVSAAFRKVHHALAATVNFLPMRILIAFIGYEMFRLHITFGGLRVMMSLFVDGGKPLNDLSDLLDAMKWFFLGYFTLIVLAKSLPRAAVVILLALSCCLYGLFLTAHVVDFGRPYSNDLRSIYLATPILIVTLDARSAWAAIHKIPSFSFEWLFVIAFNLMPHLIFLFCIYFLYEVAFGLYKVDAPARDRVTEVNSG